MLMFLLTLNCTLSVPKCKASLNFAGQRVQLSPWFVLLTCPQISIIIYGMKEFLQTNPTVSFYVLDPYNLVYIIGQSRA